MSKNLDGTDTTYADCIEGTYRDLRPGDAIYNGLQTIPVTATRMTASDTASWMNFRTPKTGRQWNQASATRPVFILRKAGTA